MASEVFLSKEKNSEAKICARQGGEISKMQVGIFVPMGSRFIQHN